MADPTWTPGGSVHDRARGGPPRLWRCHLHAGIEVVVSRRWLEPGWTWHLEGLGHTAATPRVLEAEELGEVKAEALRRAGDVLVEYHDAVSGAIHALDGRSYGR